MHLFQSATLKLTMWYLGIIMLISIGFSTVLYNLSTAEIMRTIPRDEALLGIINPSKFQIIRQSYIEKSEERIGQNLLLINVAMLAIGGAASYMLARRTLQPIEEAMEAQGRFVSDASHELRTPLTALHTEIEIALRDPKLNKTQLQALLKSNLEEVDKLHSLSDRLLQLTNGKDMPMTEISIEEAAIEATNRVIALAQAKDISIENTVMQTYIRGNLESITDLLTILLDNAIKYSPNGSNITLSSLVQNKNALIRVRDNGAGIDASDMPHIFDRFYRADTSRTQNDASGYGLGLSIAKKIADIHQGVIEVESTAGRGTTFDVRLPLS